MLKRIYLDIEEQLLKNVNEKSKKVGLDIQSLVKMFFTRVAKDSTLENTFSFLTSFECGELDNVEDDLDDFLQDSKMTKNKAKHLFREKRFILHKNTTFASKNRSGNYYWANPNFDVLEEDWSLILNDVANKKLYLFDIPAGRINSSELISRSDRAYLIDLQIAYGDSTFTDDKSGFSFLRYLKTEISY